MKTIHLPHYEAPATEVLEVEVECGFAQSQGWESPDWKPGNNDWFN